MTEVTYLLAVIVVLSFIWTGIEIGYIWRQWNSSEPPLPSGSVIVSVITLIISAVIGSQSFCILLNMLTADVPL